MVARDRWFHYEAAPIDQLSLEPLIHCLHASKVGYQTGGRGRWGWRQRREGRAGRGGRGLSGPMKNLKVEEIVQGVGGGDWGEGRSMTVTDSHGGK